MKTHLKFNPWKIGIVIGMLIFLIHLSVPAPAHAAVVFVPELEMFMEGKLFNDVAQFAPSITTVANLNIDILASDNFGAKIRIGHLGEFSQKILIGEQLLNQLLSIELLSLTIGTPFETPLYVEVFSGQHDIFGTGQEFERIFNIDGVGASYEGLEYFDHNALYEGMYQVDGTGLVLATEFGTNFASMRWYIYRSSPITKLDTNDAGDLELTLLDADTYSTDIRLMFDVNHTIQIDFYAGMSYSTMVVADEDLPHYTIKMRTGIMAQFGTGEQFSLFMHFGAPYLTVDNGAFGFPLEARANVETGIATPELSSFQAIFEPRFNIDDSFGANITLLIKPIYYNNYFYDDPGFEANAKIFVGSFNAGRVRGGVDVINDFSRDLTYESLDLAPFLGFTAGGVVWDLGANIRLIPFSLPVLISNLSISMRVVTKF